MGYKKKDIGISRHIVPEKVPDVTGTDAVPCHNTPLHC